MAVDHKALGAVEREAVAGACSLKRDPLGPVLGAFIDRERGDELAGRDVRQVLLALRRVAGARQCGGGEQRGR